VLNAFADPAVGAHKAPSVTQTYFFERKKEWERKRKRKEGRVGAIWEKLELPDAEGRMDAPDHRRHL